MSILSQSVAVDQIQQFVARRKVEFHSILTRETTLPLNSSSMVTSSSITDSTTYELQDEYFMAYDGLSTEVIPDLRRIAMEMNSAGHLRDCVDVYKCVRKPFVDTHLRRIGIENFIVGNAKTIPLEDLKRKIDLWIRAAHFCIRILFKREKKVYEQIFEGTGTATYEECFVATVKDAAVQLFSFADAVSSTSRNANKLFKILDFYKALSDLSSDIGVLFPPESARFIPIDTQKQLSQLKEVVLRTLSDFENSLVHEVSTISEPAGTIHRLTKFVMDYVSRIQEYKKILGQLIESNPPTSFRDLVIPDLEFVNQEGRTTPLGLHLILIIVVLSFNLEGKFKNYEDPSLVSAPDVRRTDSPLFHLFMMNNVHYIVQHIKGDPELKEVVGDDYLSRLTEKVRLEMNCGENLICVKLLHCLRDEGLRGSTCVSTGVSKRVVRERIRMFNARLEEVQRAQSTWVVPDVQLRDELRQSISAELVPAYDSFLKQYGRDIENRRRPNIIKFSVEELGTFISTSFFS
ncbi:hypothetical protein LguiA_010060 [Lonicera macranthoides]